MLNRIPITQSMLYKNTQKYRRDLHVTVRRVLTFSVLGIALMSSCKDDPKDTDKDGIPDDKDKCPLQCAKTTDGCSPQQPINSVRFFIDRSASMSGYYKGETEFVNANDYLLAKMESVRPVKEIWLVSDGAEKFNGDADKFREQVLRTQPQSAKSSMMDKIFDTIAAKTGTNDISVFVSDGILSYTDQDIKKNKNVNREKASALGTKVLTIFDKLKKGKDFGVSIYAFKSLFNGIYYNYRNEKIKLAGVQRPYYIWIIGQKDQLKKFDTELTKFSNFKPLEQLHFGFDEQSVTGPRFIPSIERSGAWNVNDEHTGIDNIGKGASTFCMILNLSALPPYAQQVTYLNAHVHIDPKGCDATLVIKDKKSVDRSKLSGNHQNADFESATHFFIITIKQMRIKTASVAIVLPVIPDTWYQNWSCDDDLKLNETCAERTFSFHYLIDGIIQAYQDNNKNYINISIPLQQ